MKCKREPLQKRQKDSRNIRFTSFGPLSPSPWIKAEKIFFKSMAKKVQLVMIPPNNIIAKIE
jgi:hypothetical protein